MLTPTPAFLCTQVVNLTRVTEKFMASLLASMTGGVVSLDGDVTIGSSVSSASAAAQGMQVRCVCCVCDVLYCVCRVSVAWSERVNGCVLL